MKDFLYEKVKAEHWKERALIADARIAENSVLMDAAADRIEALEAALRASQMALNAVRILMKNQDRREHEEKIYDGVRITLDMVEAALAPEQDK